MGEENQEKASFGMKALCFFIPIIGLIFFAVYNSTKPKYAKGCGIAGLIGFITIPIVIVIFVAITFALVIAFMNTATDIIETDSLSYQEIAAYNSKFDIYEGSSVSGSNVKTLITMVRINNEYNYGNIVDVYVNGVKMYDLSSTSAITAGSKYNVRMSYDSTGYINRINITLTK